jgi:DNA-directed RNA polymerase specialized sigma54-like protein
MELTLKAAQRLSYNAGLEQSLKILGASFGEVLSMLKEEAVSNPVVDAESFFEAMKPIFYKDAPWGAEVSDNVSETEESLFSYLKEQAGCLALPLNIASCLDFLIDLLDENGYLPYKTQEIVGFAPFRERVIEEANARFGSWSRRASAPST